jgi:serine/threonine-protein kinase RsbW
MDAASPESRSVTLAVVNEPNAIEQAQAQVVAALEQEGYPKSSLFAVRLALHEALSNAFHHGHRDLPPTVPVTLCFRVARDTLELTVQDQGPGFEPSQVPDPTLDANLERTSGRGLMLIRAYMASVRYLDNGRLVEMIYRRPGAK